MPLCEIGELEQGTCEHSYKTERTRRSIGALILISASSQAHFDGCPHKGDDPNMSNWGELETENAWMQLGNGEHLQANRGQRPDRIATSRCRDCIEYGPWK